MTNTPCNLSPVFIWSCIITITLTGVFTYVFVIVIWKRRQENNTSVQCIFCQLWIYSTYYFVVICVMDVSFSQIDSHSYPYPMTPACHLCLVSQSYRIRLAWIKLWEELLGLLLTNIQCTTSSLCMILTSNSNLSNLLLFYIIKWFFFKHRQENQETPSALAKQIKWEENHLGNFRQIYPNPEGGKYEIFFSQTQSSLFQETFASRAREEACRLHREECEVSAVLATMSLIDKMLLYQGVVASMYWPHYQFDFNVINSSINFVPRFNNE